MLAIFPTPKEVPWSGPNSFQATLGATLHTSWELDHNVLSEPDSVDWIVEGPVVEAVVCTIADMVAGALAGIVADPL